MYQKLGYASLNLLLATSECLCFRTWSTYTVHPGNNKHDVVPHLQVLANDLNPNSYKYLQQNVQLNKVQNKVQAFNMDGRTFMRHLCSGQPSNPAVSGILAAICEVIFVAALV